jgi:ATP-dependent DNA ligase
MDELASVIEYDRSKVARARKLLASPSKLNVRAVYTPQLPTLVKSPPSGDEWIHEVKYDGCRIGALVADGAVTLLTRNGND